MTDYNSLASVDLKEIKLNTVDCQSLKVGDALIEVDSEGVVIKLKNSTTGIYEVLIRFYK